MMVIFVWFLALVSLSSSSILDEGWNTGLKPTNIFYRTIMSSLLQNCTELKETLGLEHSKIFRFQARKLTLELWYQSKINTEVPESKGDIEFFQIGKEAFKLTRDHPNIMNSPNFRKDLPVIVFIHGFHSSSRSEEPRGVAGILVDKVDSNVLVLDSSRLISTIYVRSTYYSSFIGNELGKYLASLHNAGVNSENMHVIGHSLGAQIAGFAGKTFKKLTGSKIARITGLDPAGPCFFEEKPDSRLSKNDAEFVDVIHTNAGVYGYINPIGDLDFYPNGGQEQPGCPVPSCSHERSWKLFVESVTSPYSFEAVECQSWEQFEAGRCNKNRMTRMGYNVDKKVKGVFYLKTEGNIPYGLGPQGIKGSSPVVDFISTVFKTIHVL